MPRGGKREGAGRKHGSGVGEGLASHVIRISSEISKEQCQTIPSLISILDDWEAKADDSPRYYYLKQMLDEIRALGF